MEKNLRNKERTLKNEFLEGEKALQVKTLAALAKVWSSVHSTLGE